MAAGMVLDIIDAIANGPEGAEYATLSIAGVDPLDSGRLYDPHGTGVMFDERAFQWWPETISDTIDIGWNFKDIPGASHALAQWASNNGRTISFEVQLSRFMKRRDKLSLREKIDLAPIPTPDMKGPIDVRPYNVDIASQIRYLRGYCYPSYRNLEGVVSAVPPPVAILYAPNMGLNESGGDAIYAIMTGCDVNYTLLFPDGTPRRASVSLTFRQIVQTIDGVRFKGFGDAPSPYDLNYKSQGEDTFDFNASRAMNGITPKVVK